MKLDLKLDAAGYEEVLKRGIITYVRKDNKYFECCLGRIVAVSEEVLKKSFGRTIL